MALTLPPPTQHVQVTVVCEGVGTGLSDTASAWPGALYQCGNTACNPTSLPAALVSGPASSAVTGPITDDFGTTYIGVMCVQGGWGGGVAGGVVGLRVGVWHHDCLTQRFGMLTRSATYTGTLPNALVGNADTFYFAQCFYDDGTGPILVAETSFKARRGVGVACGRALQRPLTLRPPHPIPSPACGAPPPHRAQVFAPQIGTAVAQVAAPGYTDASGFIHPDFQNCVVARATCTYSSSSHLATALSSYPAQYQLCGTGSDQTCTGISLDATKPLLTPTLVTTPLAGQFKAFYTFTICNALQPGQSKTYRYFMCSYDPGNVAITTQAAVRLAIFGPKLPAPPPPPRPPPPPPKQ